MDLDQQLSETLVSVIKRSCLPIRPTISWRLPITPGPTLLLALLYPDVSRLLLVLLYPDVSRLLLVLLYPDVSQFLLKSKLLFRLYPDVLIEACLLITPDALISQLVFIPSLTDSPRAFHDLTEALSLYLLLVAVVVQQHHFLQQHCGVLVVKRDMFYSRTINRSWLTRSRSSLGISSLS